jgi:hypothetical protein
MQAAEPCLRAAAPLRRVVIPRILPAAALRERCVCERGRAARRAASGVLHEGSSSGSACSVQRQRRHADACRSAPALPELHGNREGTTRSCARAARTSSFSIPRRVSSVQLPSSEGRLQHQAGVLHRRRASGSGGGPSGAAALGRQVLTLARIGKSPAAPLLLWYYHGMRRSGAGAAAGLPAAAWGCSSFSFLHLHGSAFVGVRKTALRLLFSRVPPMWRGQGQAARHRSMLGVAVPVPPQRSSASMSVAPHDGPAMAARMRTMLRPAVRSVHCG